MVEQVLHAGAWAALTAAVTVAGPVCYIAVLAAFVLIIIGFRKVGVAVAVAAPLLYLLLASTLSAVGN